VIVVKVESLNIKRFYAIYPNNNNGDGDYIKPKNFIFWGSLNCFKLFKNFLYG
jgi:hypothetical protein